MEYVYFNETMKTDRGLEVHRQVALTASPMSLLAQLIAPMIADRSLCMAVCSPSHASDCFEGLRGTGFYADQNTDAIDLHISCEASDERAAKVYAAHPGTPTAEYTVMIARDSGIADPQREGFQIAMMYYYRVYLMPDRQWSLQGMSNSHLKIGDSIVEKMRRTGLTADSLSLFDELFRK